MIPPLNFTAFDHNFCESRIYATDGPEYFNALSSLFITLTGVYGLTRQNTLLYTAFIMNGLTSCGYHWYHTLGWGILDRMSMILIAFSCVTLADIPCLLRVKEGQPWHGKMYNLLVMTYFTAILTVTALHWEATFNALFAVFLVSLIGYVYYMTVHQETFRIPHNILVLATRGVKLITLSGLFWIVTENFCGIVFVKYMFGHVWWHLFVSYGGYLISLLPLYLCSKSSLKYECYGLPFFTERTRSLY
jgi:hypothetical protein